MSRQPKFPPSIHHHKPSGQARVRWKGRDYYLGVNGSEGAKAAYARLIAVLAAGGAPEPKSAAPALTVADVTAAWVREEMPRYDPRGREPPMFVLSLRPLNRLFGPTPAAAFDAAALEAVRMAMVRGSWMTAEEKAAARRVGWCRNVVNRRVVRIRTVWRWAELRGLVPRGSWANLLSLPGLAANDGRVRQTPRRTSAAWDDVKAACRELSPTVRAMLLLQWWTGMRSSEVRIMRPSDVQQTAGEWVYRPAHHKGDWRAGDAGRAVPLGPKCRAILRLPLASAAAADAPLFQARPGTAYTAFSYAQAVRRAARRAGVKLQPYQCRHAFRERVSRLLSLDHARAAMGHKSLQMTARYGNPVDTEKATEVARRLG